jgi:hypothetical protein
MRAYAIAAIVFCCVAAAACSDNPTPSAPTPTFTVDGTWQTDVVVSGQTARMTWALTQSGTSVSGPVTVALPNGIVLMNGSLAGTVSGATATAATLAYTISVNAGGIPTQPSCSGQFGGTMNASAGVPSKMTGDFSVKSTTCTPPFSAGTITLTKQ